MSESPEPHLRPGVKDVHCGMRAVGRDVLPRFELRATGMEFASEMVIRAAKAGLDIREFPIQLHPRADSPSRA